MNEDKTLVASLCLKQVKCFSSQYLHKIIAYISLPNTHPETSNTKMASLNFFVPPIVTPQRRVRTAATAAKSSGGSTEEKGLLDFILGKIAKQDQFYETDPILQKVEGKSGGTTASTTSSRKNTVAVPTPKKKEGGFGLGGLGGIFTKK